LEVLTMPGRVRRRKALAVRSPDVPSEEQRRWERNHLMTLERAARLGLAVGHEARLTDAELADLMAKRRAEDDAELEARRRAAVR
jgi:hypothetical protein